MKFFANLFSIMMIVCISSLLCSGAPQEESSCRGIGTPCDVASECCTSFCQPHAHICVPSPGPNPGPEPIPPPVPGPCRAEGIPCTASSECCSSFCHPHAYICTMPY